MIVESTASESDKKWKKYLAVTRRPVFLIIINFFVVNTLFSLLPFTIGNVIYTIGRISIIFYAGWLVTRKHVGGVWKSSLTGAGLYFIDHVLLKGGIFLLNYLFKPQGVGLAAFGGVVVSYLIFMPLAMLIGAIGGFIARSREERPAANSH